MSACNSLIIQTQILGICYGLQLIAHTFGGKVEPADHREYGHATVAKAHIDKNNNNSILHEMPDQFDVWMSHGDSITQLPVDFVVTAGTSSTAFACVQNQDQSIYGTEESE